MAKELKIPTTEHSYEDVLLLYQAQKIHMPMDKVDVEISSIKKIIQN